MKRTFNIADPRLLEHGGIVLEALKVDLPAFSGFDPDLNENLVAELRELHESALHEGGDDAARGKVGVKTQTLLNAMAACKKVVKRLRYWVKKTYDNDPAKRKRFQLTRFWNVADNQPELIVYMSALVSTVDELRSELEAANTPADLLDSIKPAADALLEANNAQENSKGGRGTATQVRVTSLNRMYKISQMLSDAAEYVFEEDPAKREIYRLPGNSKPSTDDEEDEDDQVTE